MPHNLTLPVSPETKALIIKLQEEQHAKEEAEKAAAAEAAKPKAKDPAPFQLGTRRLCDLTPDVRRPLECYQASLKRREGMTREMLSSKLDLHIDDLDALAATAGSL